METRGRGYGHWKMRPAMCWRVSIVPALGLLVAAHSVADAADGARAGANTLTVSAAASLADAFRTLGAAFEKTQGGAIMTFNFAASSALAEQIKQGAPADVFASADEVNMQKVADAGELAAPARIFATNRLTIVVEPGNPQRIASLADLTRSGLTLALAAPAVPAGKYAAEAFAKAKLAVPPASHEADVRAALNRVVLGEADAAIVYVTDARAAGTRVEAVAIPDAHNVAAKYPIAVLKDAADPKRAAAFVDFVLSSAGQAMLSELGFQ